MRNKHLGMVVFMTALSTAAYFIVKKILVHRKETTLKDSLVKAKEFYLNKEYENSIKYYNVSLGIASSPETQSEIYKGIAKCQIGYRDYDKAVEYLNKSLSINLRDNLDVLKWRSRCHSKSQNKRMCLLDYFLYTSLSPNPPTEEETRKMDKACLSFLGEETRLFIDQNTLPPSNMLYEDFFDTFVGILPEGDDRIGRLLKDREYEVLNKTLMHPHQAYSDGLFTTKVIEAGLFYIKGLYKKALDCIEEPTNIFESLFRKFVKSYVSKEPPVLLQKEVDVILESNNPTLIFYLSKVYYIQKNEQEYLRTISLIKTHLFVYYDLLLFYKGKRLHSKFKECANEALSKFGSNFKILSVCGQYAIENKDVDFLTHVSLQMDYNDPRNLLFKAQYLIGFREYDPAKILLYKTIERDPTCFKAYFDLGSILCQSDFEAGKSIWKEGLSRASNYNEVFSMIQNLWYIEVHEYLIKNLYISK